MLRRVRELGPPVLVPFAWVAVTAVHLDTLGETGLLIAHVVMATFLGLFAVTGRGDMQDGVLERWWQLITVGLFVTLSGIAGFQLDTAGDLLLATSLFGWMVLPAIGFVYTGQRVSEGRWVYALGTVGCVLGASLYAVGLSLSTDIALVAGLALVGAGQTAGILDASLRY
jgi:hypothetical protein